MTEDEDDSPFYPGSKRVKLSQGGEKVRLPEDTEQSWERLGVTYLVQGVPTKLFPISALAEALGRKSITMRKWERDGALPDPTMRTNSGSPRGRRRMYTRDQVLGLQRIAKELGLMDNKRKYVTRTEFGARARELFKELAEK